MSAVVVVRSYGGPEVLTVEQVDVPPPAPGEVAVQVAAVGVNFIDTYRRSGVYAEPLPHAVGREGSGTVIAVGDGVDLALGQRVAWADGPGSYAQIVNVLADRLVPVPDGVTDEQAAAFPLQGLTAHYLATGSFRIQPGDIVLVHAGAGGVGLLLTQIATILGARVITTVSTQEKAELSKAAGAWHVLVGYDHFADRVRELTDGVGVQAVYDGVGKDTFDGSLASLAVRGTMVLFGGASGPVPPFDLQRLNSGGSLSITRPTLVHFTRTREELLARSADVLGWVADGRLDLRIGSTYPLAEAARAHEDLEGRRTTGKVLLLP